MEMILLVKTPATLRAPTRIPPAPTNLLRYILSPTKTPTNHKKKSLKIVYRSLRISRTVTTKISFSKLKQVKPSQPHQVILSLTQRPSRLPSKSLLKRVAMLSRSWRISRTVTTTTLIKKFYPLQMVFSLTQRPSRLQSKSLLRHMAMPLSSRGLFLEKV